jgi:hypothetical protein
VAVQIVNAIGPTLAEGRPVVITGGELLTDLANLTLNRPDFPGASFS